MLRARNVVTNRMGGTIFLALLLSGVGAGARGQSALITYVETDLGGGQWLYDYTVANTSDPALLPDANLYDVTFTVDPNATFSTTSLPAGWSDNPTPGALEVQSTFVGAPPVGTDIAPGDSLSGFQFQFDYRAGDLPYIASFSTLTGATLTYTGTSSAAGPATTPEPGAFAWVAGMALSGTVFGRRKRRSRLENQHIMRSLA